MVFLIKISFSNSVRYLVSKFQIITNSKADCPLPARDAATVVRLLFLNLYRSAGVQTLSLPEQDFIYDYSVRQRRLISSILVAAAGANSYLCGRVRVLLESSCEGLAALLVSAILLSTVPFAHCHSTIGCRCRYYIFHN